MHGRWLALTLVCSATIFAAGDALAQTSTAVKPYFMVIVDNSGSMNASTGAGNNSCGQPRTRFNDAKCVVQQIVNAYGDVVFGMIRFRMTVTGSCGCTETYIDCGACNENTGAGCPASGSTADQGEVLVPIYEDNQAQMLSWVDFSCGTCSKTGANPELDYGTWTPIGGALRGARRYYRGLDPEFPTSPIAVDPFNTCRPYYVILLTDGDESCSTFTSSYAAATELRTTNVGGVNYDIRTFPIGFGMTGPDTQIETYAANGGTDAPGPNLGFYASDETTLALAFAQIIEDSVLVESCNGVDDNCDGVADEGFPTGPCDGPDADTCPEGVFVCNAAGTGVDCTDMTGTNAEVCNGVDDDCDTLIDEPPADCSGCVPQPEICNGVDDDCDGLIDEGITRACGNDVGVCTGGTQDCVELTMPAPEGTWGPCSGIGPAPESCDGLDNDCDGVVDGIADACGNPAVGQCQPGTTICTSGMWGPCIGEIGPGTEGCDGIDNDCDGTVDDGNPGGGAPCGTECGPGVTECMGGMLICVGGSTGGTEVCNGIDDDCDGLVDEDLGTMGPCDEGGTLCIPGTLECVGGEWMCVGGAPAEPEVCDCVDNDCDGTADDPDPGPLCAPGATCLSGPYCQCARPCADDEFPCPEGRYCTNPDDPLNGFCIVDPCYMVACPSGEACDRDDGTCKPLCELVECTAPLVCRPTDGACVPDNCNFFPDLCTDGELCVNGVCEADPCAGVSCPDPSTYCLDGTCVASCAGVECPDGQSCEVGACVDDDCAGVSCPEFQVCDPATGECVQDRCLGLTCPPGQTCDPVSGVCVEDPCLGVECPAGQVCQGGSCYDPEQLMPDPDAGPNTYVAAAGGGCGCATAPSPGAPLGALVVGGLALALVRRRRR